MAFYRGGGKSVIDYQQGLMMIWKGFWEIVCEEMHVHSFNSQGRTDFSEPGAAVWDVWRLRVWLWSFGKANVE